MVLAARSTALLLLLMGLCGFALHWLPVGAAAPGGHAVRLAIDGPIEPTLARFLSRGLDTASEDGAQLIVLVVDTPGGMLDTTREMVEDILAADVPVVAYVGPAGAQAASAGTFIVASAHLAAMAPGTNIGAASPVGPTGEDLPKTAKSKATQDAAAFIRSIAEKRGRESDPLEETVLAARAFSHSEALEAGIIDLTAETVEDLLSEIDGTSIELDSGESIVLETRGVPTELIERNPVERFLAFLANPNVAFLLLTIGGLGLIVELFNPGMIVPALVGVICLALAYVAFGSLPVNWVGVGLIALAMLLFFLELQAPGIGVFGIGGALTFLLGAFLLFGGFTPPPIETPSFRVSPWMIGVVSAVLFGFLVVLFRMAIESRRLTYPQAVEGMVGSTGKVISDLDPRGTVQVASERWTAVSESGQPISEGEEVVVLDVEGLTLKVAESDETSR